MTVRKLPSVRPIIMMLSVLALCAVAACSETPEVQKRRALDRGERYLRQSKPNEAVIELRKALQIDPKFVPALHALGLAYIEKAWFGDAYRELRRAREASPDSVPIAVDFGTVLVEIGDWTAAEDEASWILERDPQNPRALAIRAGALLGREKPEAAAAVLESAPPGAIPGAERLRADVLLASGKVDQAEEIYRTFLATNPDDLKTLIGLGAIALQRGRLDEAKQYYQQAKRSHPFDPRPPIGLAKALAHQGDLAGAITQLEEIDLRAQNVEALHTLGLFYLQANRLDDAARFLRLVVVQYPSVPGPRYLLATALSLMGDPKAVEQFEELDRQLPNNQVIQLRLASAYTDNGRPRDALVRLDGIPKQSQKTAAYYLEQGRALFFLGRPDEAFTAASAAQRLAPQMPQPYVLIGQIFAQRGDLKKAEASFTKATEVDASFLAGHLAASQTYLDAKDVDAALRSLDAAIKTNPNSLQAITAKAMVMMQQHRAKDAIAFVEETTRNRKVDAGLFVLLGNLYAANDQPTRAATAFQQALDIDRRSVTARLGLGRVLITQGKEDEGVAQLQAAVRDKPDDVRSVLVLRSVYQRQGRPDQAVALLEAAVKASPRQPTFVLALSEVYIGAGRYDDAIGRTSELLDVQRDLALARLIRGRAYLAKGDARAAQRDFQEAVHNDPKSAAAHYYLSQAYVLLGQKQEAAKEYREVIRLDPAFTPARRALAALKGEPPDEQSQRQEIEKLQAIVKADPKNVLAREEMARAYLAGGRSAEAEGELKEIINLAPLLPEPNFLLAQLLLTRKQEDDAANYLRAALRGNPSHVMANVLLARYLIERRQREQAIRLLETAHGVNPNQPEVQYLLATLYGELGRFSDALSLAKELQRLEPKSTRPWILGGTLLVADQNPRGAVAAFEKALAIDPRSAEAHRELGQAYFLLGQGDRAEQSYRRALELKADDVAALNDLAWLLSESKNRPNEALPLARKAERLAPDVAWVADTLGWILYRTQSYAEAEKVLAQALNRAPSNAAIRFHLGMTYVKLGRRDDAVSALRRAAQLDPKLAEREGINKLIKELEG